MDIDDALSTVSGIRETVRRYAGEGLEAEGDVYRALDRLEQYMTELYDDAYTDEATGIPNRKGFRKKAESRSYTGEVSVLLLDLDYFKLANDVCGHDVGDDVLRVVADSIRDTDICGRYGGDEFLVLLPGTGNDGANTAAGRIRESFSRGMHDYIESNRDSLGDAGAEALGKVGVSIGVATANGYVPLDEMMKRADDDLLAKKDALHKENGASR
ncbi:MAG: hypothetical protein DRO99_02240 [Candidatus Aenigmatarchaeota archaeon]|nr:MAG: hypothetical protein DRO99_02240 [Candidatus Aenigmarchaeota archaeon]